MGLMPAEVDQTALPFLAQLDRARSLFDARQTEIRHFAGVGSRHPDRDEPRLSQIPGIEATSVVFANIDVHDHQIVFTRQYSLQFFRSEDMPDDLARRVAKRSIVLGSRGERTPSSAEAAPAATLNRVLFQTSETWSLPDSEIVKACDRSMSGVCGDDGSFASERRSCFSTISPRMTVCLPPSGCSAAVAGAAQNCIELMTQKTASS